MRWKKLGLILAPDKSINWMTHYVGPSCVRSDGGKTFIYVTGRDKDNISRIGMAEVDINGESLLVKSVTPKPVFDIGEPGLFDESGVSYPWLVEHENRIYMYYAGWYAGGKTRFINFTGLAISEDGGFSFHRPQKSPVLDRIPEEPYGSGSCCVFIDRGTWKMYYTAFDPWDVQAEIPIPHYNIKFAWSQDGLVWRREQKIIVDYQNPDETVIGKPVLVKEAGTYRLWYSFRGPAYRIGYAESADGLTYVRHDESVGIDVSPSGWDSQMIEYAFVFDHKGKRYMIYNGNNFGKTGLGWAVLDEGAR